MPARFADLGDLHAGIDDESFGSTSCSSGPIDGIEPAKADVNRDGGHP